MADTIYKWAVVGDSLSDNINGSESAYAPKHYYTRAVEKSNGRYQLVPWPGHTKNANSNDLVAVFAIGSSGYAMSRDTYSTKAGHFALASKIDGYPNRDSGPPTPWMTEPYLDSNISQVDHFVTRISSIDSDTDITTIFGTINDWRTSTNADFSNHAQYPLGTLPDTETSNGSLTYLQNNPITCGHKTSGALVGYVNYKYSLYACMAQTYFDWRKTVTKQNAKLLICGLLVFAMDYGAWTTFNDGRVPSLRNWQYTFAKKYSLPFYDFAYDYGFICPIHTTKDRTANLAASNALTDADGNPILDKNGNAVDWYGKSLWSGQMFWKRAQPSGESHSDYVKRMASRLQFCRLFVGDFYFNSTSRGAPTGVFVEILQEAGCGAATKWPQAQHGHFNGLYNEIALGSQFKDILDYETGLNSHVPKNLVGGSLPAMPEYAVTERGERVHAAIFKADGVEVDRVMFTEGSSELYRVPNVPDKDGKSGEWSTYTLGTSDIIVDATYGPSEWVPTGYALGSNGPVMSGLTANNVVVYGGLNHQNQYLEFRKQE